MSESPMLDSFTFHKIMPYSKKNSDILFASLCKGASTFFLISEYISVYEIFCVLILCSYQTYKKKFQCNIPVYP